MAAVAVAWLVYLVPWFAARGDTPYDKEADPQFARFANSMRVLRGDVLSISSETEVSTPLTRRAELAEVREVVKTAARRRRIVLGVLLLSWSALAVANVYQLVPWWSPWVPVAMILIFLVIARFSVVAMHNRLDLRVQTIMAGWQDEEDTETLVLSDQERSVSMEVTTVSNAEHTPGSLWEPIPVVSPTYVSQMNAPRTVRTIDLSAPEPHVVPTADSFREEIDEGEIAEAEEHFEYRAVNE